MVSTPVQEICSYSCSFLAYFLHISCLLQMSQVQEILAHSCMFLAHFLHMSCHFSNIPVQEIWPHSCTIFPCFLHKSCTFLARKQPRNGFGFCARNVLVLLKSCKFVLQVSCKILQETCTKAAKFRARLQDLARTCTQVSRFNWNLANLGSKIRARFL